MNVERQLHIRARAPVPSRQLGNHQLDLVEEPGADRSVPGPRVLAVVVQEIADLEVLADRKVHIGFTNLQKAFRRILLSRDSLGEICPDAISVEHRTFLLPEWDEHRDRKSADDTLLLVANQCEPIEPGFGGSDHFRPDQRPRNLDSRAVAYAHPAVSKGGRVAVNVERILDHLSRQRELEQDAAARAECSRRWCGDREASGQECTKRLRRKTGQRPHELNGAYGRDENQSQRYDQGGTFMAIKSLVRQRELPAGNG